MSNSTKAPAHHERQILALDQAVKVVDHSTRRRFGDTDWQASSLRRELRDRPSFTEAVTLQGDSLRTRFIDHETKQVIASRAELLYTLPEQSSRIALAVHEPPPPAYYELAVPPTLQAEAAARLAEMSSNDRRMRAGVARGTVKPAAVKFEYPRWLIALALFSALLAAVSARF
jgi:hypothetical protein